MPKEDKNEQDNQDLATSAPRSHRLRNVLAATAAVGTGIAVAAPLLQGGPNHESQANVSRPSPEQLKALNSQFDNAFVELSDQVYSVVNLANRDHGESLIATNNPTGKSASAPAGEITQIISKVSSSTTTAPETYTIDLSLPNRNAASSTPDDEKVIPGSYLTATLYEGLPGVPTTTLNSGVGTKGEIVPLKTNSNQFDTNTPLGSFNMWKSLDGNVVSWNVAISYKGQSGETRHALFTTDQNDPNKEDIINPEDTFAASGLADFGNNLITCAEQQTAVAGFTSSGLPLSGN
jgi:hypothetical protein